MAPVARAAGDTMATPQPADGTAGHYCAFVVAPPRQPPAHAPRGSSPRISFSFRRRAAADRHIAAQAPPRPAGLSFFRDDTRNAPSMSADTTVKL